MRRALVILSSFIFIAATALFLMSDFFPKKTDKTTEEQVSRPTPSKNNTDPKTKENITNDTSEIAVNDATTTNQSAKVKTDIAKVLAEQKISYLRHSHYFNNQRNIFALSNRSEEEKAVDALQFNPYWGLEADFANLKSAHKGQGAALDKASEVRFRDSAESSAMMINIIGLIPLTDKSSFFAKVGVNNWEIEESQANELSANQRPVYGQPGMNSDLDGGTDMFYGIGFKYDYDSFILKSEMQVFEINGEEHEVFTIGGDFKF
ncbi:hypothetical protein RI844_13130 [Thalassotalea fonticola]|uniref:Outer membrane protein beta-barrel domain-containing protein n=1 Tax=Thalassotalea fonticola TaxID=3065649 RepID=A0ABZ0GKK0_9GAMM|nr:hypothetical protein RI844_13130 [Colwelliaceae bacterium S1-1]